MKIIFYGGYRLPVLCTVNYMEEWFHFQKPNGRLAIQIRSFLHVFWGCGHNDVNDWMTFINTRSPRFNSTYKMWQRAWPFRPLTWTFIVVSGRLRSRVWRAKRMKMRIKPETFVLSWPRNASMSRTRPRWTLRSVTALAARQTAVLSSASGT